MTATLAVLGVAFLIGWSFVEVCTRIRSNVLRLRHEVDKAGQLTDQLLGQSAVLQKDNRLLIAHLSRAHEAQFKARCELGDAREIARQALEPSGCVCGQKPHSKACTNLQFLALGVDPHAEVRLKVADAVEG